MMNKTAVQWLVERLRIQGYDHIVEQALEIEKDQVIDSYDTGFTDAWSLVKEDNKPEYEGAEHYYITVYGV